MVPPNLPSKEDVLTLAHWVLECPIIKKNYALAGGAWLTLRLPKESRLSKDVDVLSSKEEISSYKAMSEIVKKCKREKISYEITRRGEHFCQIFVAYPKGLAIKVDIGKIWRPVTLLYDPHLRCPILSELDMVLEKLHCIVDRIEPTDLYDLCLLHKSYPREFKKVLEDLSQGLEASELIVQIQRCLELTQGAGTKETLTKKEHLWMESYIKKAIRDITLAVRSEEDVEH